MLLKPLDNEYPEYYQFYIRPMPADGILEFLEKQTKEVINLYNTLSEEKLLYRYAQNKWSIKELICHLLDSELIMGYRALTYARKDLTNLPMYDHDKYVYESNADKIKSGHLIAHYSHVRDSNLFLFKSFTELEWNQKGLTGGKEFTTRTIPYIVAGHTAHHIKILKERYLC